MAAPALDATDRQLIEILSSDARVSNRKIAVALGVTEGTVRGRIKRLQQEGLIAFTAITGFDVGQRARLAFINIKADVHRVREVAQAVADTPGINAVLITMGQLNITAICLIEELDTLVELASDQILAIDGVHHVETSIAVRTAKYNSRMAKITRPAVIEDDEGPE
jgi:DNA-binding Lrp family transcriptional regulator